MILYDSLIVVLYEYSPVADENRISGKNSFLKQYHVLVQYY